MDIKSIDVQTAKAWLDKGEAVLIDVREPAEHASSSIQGSTLEPLGSICCGALPQTNKKIILHCKRGGRSQNACKKLLLENKDLDLYNLSGGIEAWIKAGLPLAS